MQKYTTNIYRDAGVDGDLASDIVSSILSSKEHKGFGAIFDIKATGLKDPLLISTTDGVGTKLSFSLKHKAYQQIAQDLVAMCVNDVVTHGAEPLYFLDYMATGSLSSEIAIPILSGIKDACSKSARMNKSCSLVGGEIAQMKGHPWELAGFAVGAVERANLLPKETHAGDLLLGLHSSGIHANGFSLVQKILDDNKHEEEKVKNELLKPTRLYVRSVLSAIDACPDGIKAIAHITGGGMMENLYRVLSEGRQVQLDYKKINGIFQWIQEKGNLSTEDMLGIFNCGIGMILVVDQNDANQLVDVFNEQGEKASIIGHLA